MNKNLCTSRMRAVWVAIVMGMMVTCIQAAEPPGLTVKDGKFFLNGKPYAGIGVNYFDAFLRVIGHNGLGPRLNNETWREGFRILKEYEIPFVRLPINGFYPADWGLYMTNRPVFFTQLDKLVGEAERQDIGLIPSFFWTFFTLPDLMGEPFDQWGNAESKTRKAMREFIREVVTRYRASPAIWAWEFGNEYLLAADLPGEDQGKGWIVPRLGTPRERTDRDKVRRPFVRAAYADFARTVREMDATRPVFSGDVMARPSAWHLLNENSWKHDDPAQWREVMLADHPDPINALSTHFYYYELKGQAKGADADGSNKQQHAGVDPPPGGQGQGPMGLDMRALLAHIQKIAAETGKPLYIGEFGTSYDLKDGERRRREFFAVLDAILAERVSLATFWVFDFSWQPLDTTSPWNDNAYILEALRDVNRRLRAEMGERSQP